MKKTQLTPTRILLEFETQKELTLHMFRFSEFFEGEKGIRGKKFAIDTFIDKYSDDKGYLDYFGYWEGYNIPKTEFDKFLKLYEGDYTKREIEVIKVVKGLPENGYIIASKVGDPITLKHEQGHGLFYENKDYREEAMNIVMSMPSKLITRYQIDLRKKHYCDDVLLDEIHAYILAYNSDDQKDLFPDIKFNEVRKYKNQLNDLYNKFLVISL